MTLNEYIARLPLVNTANLPKGALFWARNRLYDVIETEPRGYNRAREWRQDESTDVALVRNSVLATRLRLIERGNLLTPIPSRQAFLQNGQAIAFVFPNEQNALDAAYLDVGLCRNAGLYVRRYEQYPSFEITNGMSVLRRYFYTQTKQGIQTRLGDVKQRLGLILVQHRHGPMYWRLLESWSENPYDPNQTQAFRPIDAERLAETRQTLVRRPQDLEQKLRETQDRTQITKKWDGDNA